MANEVKQRESAPESLSGDQSPPEVEEQNPDAETVITELENLVAQRDEALARANVRLVELEELIASRDGEIAALRQTEAELEERLLGSDNALSEAVTSYKTVVVQANPEVIEELISGDTIEAINQSLDKAKALVSKVRQGVEAEISLTRVPAGAPERTVPDLSALSPREKIQYAIGGSSS